MASQVTLIADCGAACVEPEFFRCEQFLTAEGVTHTLRIDAPQGRVNIPLIRRSIPKGGEWDAISPRGHPGGSLTGDVLDINGVDLSHLGIVSLFLRDRIGSRTLRGGRIRSKVFVHDPALARHTRREEGKDVRRNERAGYRSEVIHGPLVDRGTLVDFARCYKQTMQRVGAQPGYFYTCDYIARCLSFEGSWLVVTRAPDSRVAAAGLVVRSDGILHGYLAGSAEEHWARSPSKNTYIASNDLADQLALPFNLGGGNTPGDGLEYLKRGFSNSQQAFVTHEVICDPHKYTELAGPNNSNGYFPAYRSNFFRLNNDDVSVAHVCDSVVQDSHQRRMGPKRARHRFN